MDKRINKIRAVIVGLLIVVTMTIGVMAINILHQNQITQNKINASLNQNKQSGQTNSLTLAENNTSTKKTVTYPKTGQKAIQNNTGTGSEQDDSSIQKTPTPATTPNVNTNYTLFVTSINGTVTSSPSGISCGSTCSATFSSGTTVFLSASATSGYTFSGWSGDCSGTGSCSVVLNSNQSLTANYTLNNNNNTSTTYTSSQVSQHNTQSDCWLIISGKVYNVTSFIPNHPGGANAIVSRCGTDVTAAFTVGSNGGHAHSAYAQSLLPTYFIGNLSSTSTTTTYTLSVTNSGTGTGTVSGGSINCGSTCSATVNSGTSVTLTATPASASTFSGWSGACSGTGSCVVSISANKSVTASFATSGVTTTGTSFTLSVTSANGTVISNPSAISCGSTCSATLNSGTSIILMVIPNSGYTFSGWSGDCSGTGSSCNVTMSGNKSVTASYKAK